MNLEGRSLAEVAAVVNRRLRESGVESVVVGESSVSIHVPQAYTSDHIDLALVTGFNRSKADLVAETPYVDQRPIREFCTIETAAGAQRALTVARKAVHNDRLSETLNAIETGDRRSSERLELARNRLSKIAGSNL